MSLKCERVQEWIAAAALGEATEPPRGALRHLDDCQACRSFRSEAGRLLEHSAGDAGEMEPLRKDPPERLREQVRSAIMSESAKPRPLRNEAREARFAVWPLVASLFMFAFVGAGGYAMQMKRELDRMSLENQQAQLALQFVWEAAREQWVEGTKGARLAGTEAAPGAGGWVAVYPDQEGFWIFVSAYDLEPLGRHGTYRAWLLQGGEKVSAGAFEVDRSGRGQLVYRGEGDFAFDSLRIVKEARLGSDASADVPVLSAALTGIDLSGAW